MRLKQFIKKMLLASETINIWKYSDTGKRLNLWSGLVCKLPKALWRERVQMVLSFSCAEINTKRECKCALNIVLKGEIKVCCATCKNKKYRDCLVYSQCHHLRRRPLWEFNNVL